MTKQTVTWRIPGWRLSVCLRSVLLLSGVALGATAHGGEARHGLSIFGELKYPPEFEHFDYANPNAIKGGSVTLGTLGTYDSLNPFILKGQSAAGAALIYDTLTVNALDEPFSVYGLLAESIEVPEDNSSVTFHLRPEARWHDGEALTAEDVVWTFDTIKSKGHPLWKTYWAAVKSAEALDEHTVRFLFSEADNAELPLITGQLAILPKHFWQGKDFSDPTLEPPLGSGPYRVDRIDAGRSITYERVEDYWADTLAVKVGHNNFDELTYDYYRDLTIMHEAFKAGEIDFKQENIAKNWAAGYDFPALHEGRVVREEIPDHSIQRMQAFVFNTRKAKFSDPRVREALGYAFDFEWLNKHIFYGAYERTRSFFQNSELQSSGLPAGGELEILERFRDELPERVFSEAFSLPVTDGSGNLRPQYRAALKLLESAGWQIRNGRLTHLESGRKMNIEMILRQPSTEKIGLAYKKALERLGVELKVRVVDTAQYQKRMETFDFELTTVILAQTRSPGNEQWDFWGSTAADTPGSRNVAGIKDPVIDQIIKLIVSAGSREALVDATRALDRVLLHSHYFIPQYHSPTYRVAYWNKFARPDVVPDNALGFATWWVDPDLAAELDQ